ncbi:hypothetical protein JCM11491_005092 [Sporobolomyces phaffii]
MLATSLAALVLTFTTAFAFASPTPPSTDGPALPEQRFRVVKRGPFVPVGKDLVGPAHQGSLWGTRRPLKPEDLYCQVDLGYLQGQPVGVCNGPEKWYEHEWRLADGVACLNNTLSNAGSPYWISVSDAFLNKNGSLRKSCGRAVEVTATTGETVRAEIHRSCTSARACPGENAIAVSPLVARDLGIYNFSYGVRNVTWKYL